MITGDEGESLNLQPSLQKERPQHGNDGEVEGLLEGAYQEDGGRAGDAGCSSHGARWGGGQLYDVIYKML